MGCGNLQRLQRKKSESVIVVAATPPAAALTTTTSTPEQKNCLGHVFTRDLARSSDVLPSMFHVAAGFKE